MRNLWMWMPSVNQYNYHSIKIVKGFHCSFEEVLHIIILMKMIKYIIFTPFDVKSICWAFLK